MTHETAATPVPAAERGRTLALLVALAVFVADQAAKIWVLGIDFTAGPIRVLPVLDITLVMNRGISYGLLQQDGLGRWLLVAFTVAASIALGVWLWRAGRAFTKVAVALILGGAVGNLVDRVIYGAVVDYVHLHWGTWSWYIFNVADAAIVVGVALLLIESLFRRADG
ncbi:signal peptidase II [Acuticoccus sediminis]|uniref:Lipoprotein signal peptidase n=1 Tax=Acuticoccus sediminis TaxID=2184697 RepID=A0A8B2NR78_9HYPH|nr:signal peptidase II [Acuticoccus sediminis]RAH99503.1 signal peptidase II [Acuticoccus sediminis]